MGQLGSPRRQGQGEGSTGGRGCGGRACRELPWCHAGLAQAVDHSLLLGAGGAGLSTGQPAGATRVIQEGGTSAHRMQVVWSSWALCLRFPPSHPPLVRKDQKGSAGWGSPGRTATFPSPLPSRSSLLVSPSRNILDCRCVFCLLSFCPSGTALYIVLYSPRAE